MSNFSSDCLSLVSFDKIYTQNIKPKLQEIDLLLKAQDPPYNLYDVATVLSISSDELLKLMKHLHIEEVDKISFFEIVFHSSSSICKLIQRQWKYTNYIYYTPEIVADIYEINIYKVKAAFEDLNQTSIHYKELDEVFKRIYTTIFLSH